MTRKEAQEKALALEAMHPWVGDYEWQVRKGESDEWIVVKVPAEPFVAPKKSNRRGRTDALRRHWGGRPPFEA